MRLIDELLSEGSLLVADHTREHWPTELRLPGPTWDRAARETWAAQGELDVNARATAEVERLLGSWDAPLPDSAIDREARATIRIAMTSDAELRGSGPAAAT